MSKGPIDFFVFGASSELAQRLFESEHDWFLKHVRRLVLVQRGAQVASAYRGFNTHVVTADAADPHAFASSLKDIVCRFAITDGHMHVFPTYGKFNWSTVGGPHFVPSTDGFQINLNARLQIIEAFRAHAANTTFHLLGSLLSNFPYLGDYATSMWYVNQLPTHPSYVDLDLRVYNLGGMKTRFWDHATEDGSNPFLHKEIPTRALREAMASDRRGVSNFYPTATARALSWLARRGARLL
jgi:hypothetical protein